MTNQIAYSENMKIVNGYRTTLDNIQLGMSSPMVMCNIEGRNYLQGEIFNTIDGLRRIASSNHSAKNLLVQAETTKNKFLEKTLQK
jgi:hypothetical protein